MDYAIVSWGSVVAEGAAARQAGKCIERCPYMRETDHAKAWCTGFLSPASAERAAVVSIASRGRLQ